MKQPNQRKAKLDVFEKHQLRIAKQTMKMPDALLGVMGGPTKAEAEETIKRLTRRGRYQPANRTL